MPSDSGSEEYPRAPAQKARDENILAVFEATDDPVLTTSEVAEELPIGKRAALNRLEDLVDRDELDSKDVGVGRVWWRESVEPEEPEPDEVAEPDPASTTPAAPTQPTGATPQPPAAPEAASDESADPLETESPRWAFIGSLGRHSILAGVFLLGLLLVEGIVQQSLLPVSPVPIFLTAAVFFLIGFPARGAYRAKKYFESTNLSLSQFVGPVGRLLGRDDSKS